MVQTIAESMKSGLQSMKCERLFAIPVFRTRYVVVSGDES